MELNSIQRDVHLLFEQMFDALDRPTIDRDHLRDLTDQAATLTMVWADPCVSVNVADLRQKGLSPKQVAIYELLLAHKGRYISRTAMMNAIWDGDVTPKNLDVQMCLLRKSLKRAGLPYELQVIPGTGSRIVDACRPA